MARGQQVYAANCAVCHRPDGKGAGRSSRSMARPRCWMPTIWQVQVLLHGQNNNAMPSWKQLSDTEIAAVVTFTKNNWSNQTGQTVQPSEVTAARAQ
jgi:cytochrome c oxidase subunit 2